MTASSLPTETKPGTVKPQSTAYRFFSTYWRIARGIGGLLESRISELASFNLKEYAILKAVQNDIRYPTGLAEHLDLSKDTTSRSLQKLLQAELLERTIDQADSRRTRLSLTPAGQEQLTQIDAELGSEIDALLSRMDSTDADQLLQHMDTLGRLLANDEANTDDTESDLD